MMQDGLLWYDDDPGRGVANKVLRAAERYQQKYGQEPTVCYVHAGQAPESVGRIKIVVSKTVLLHHFWLGREDAASKAAK